VGLFWHAGCISLGTGCLYLAPIERPGENHVPKIVQPFPPEGNTLEMLADVEVVTVIATDQDDDDLLFIWQVTPSDVQYSVSPPTPQTQPNGQEVWVSVLTIDRDSRMDGRTLECDVTDLFDDPVRVSWNVKVEE
jgi:hypothetical protein